MRLHTAALALSAAALLITGCSRTGGDGAPLGCRQGAAALSEALREAPGRVRLGGTPLSECIDETSRAGELQEVGEAYVGVAARLADAAVEEPHGAAALQLGYLMGALRRGRAPAHGAGYELARRMRSELVRVNVRSPAFRRGERAGRRHG